MENNIGQRINLLRKKRGLSQEKLGEILKISFQAISKWENGYSYPDIDMITKLAEAFSVTTDYILLGQISKGLEFYNSKYDKVENFSIVEPSNVCYEVMKEIPPVKRVKLLEICCGEGNDALFFARNGYEVTCFDLSEIGVNKLKKKANQQNIRINAFVADLKEFRLQETYDIIYLNNALHYIPLHIREEIITNYKNHTNHNGMHFLSGYVKKPFITSVSNEEPVFHDWYSGELLRYYHDWEIIDSGEFITDCESDTSFHQHATSFISARKK